MKKKSKYEAKTKSVVFHNGKGDRIFIPEDYTINDLFKLGLKQILIEKKGSFLPDGWYSKVKQQPERKHADASTRTRNAGARTRNKRTSKPTIPA